MKMYSSPCLQGGKNSLNLKRYLVGILHRKLNFPLYPYHSRLLAMVLNSPRPWFGALMRHRLETISFTIRTKFTSCPLLWRFGSSQRPVFEGFPPCSNNSFTVPKWPDGELRGSIGVVPPQPLWSLTWRPSPRGDTL